MWRGMLNKSVVASLCLFVWRSNADIAHADIAHAEQIEEISTQLVVPPSPAQGNDGKATSIADIGPVPSKHLPTRPNERLLVSGWILLSTAHANSLVVFSAIAPEINCGFGEMVPPNCQGIAPMYWSTLIPVVGPFVSAVLAFVPDKAKSYFAPDGNPAIQMSWALSWVLMNGIPQVVGLAKIIKAYTHPQIASVAHVRHDGLKVVPYSNGVTSGLSVLGSF